MLVWWSILWQAETPALLDAGLRNERFRCQVSGKKNKKAEKLQTRLRKDALILALVCNQLLARIIHASVSRDREDGCATWQPSRGTAGLNPRRTRIVRRRFRGPRTPGRTGISTVVATDS